MKKTTNLKAYVSGFSNPSGTARGWAYSLYDGAKKINDDSAGGFKVSNTQMELKAAFNVINLFPPNTPITIFSQYLTDGIDKHYNAWKDDKWRWLNIDKKQIKRWNELLINPESHSVYFKNILINGDYRKYEKSLNEAQKKAEWRSGTTTSLHGFK